MIPSVLPNEEFKISFEFDINRPPPLTTLTFSYIDSGGASGEQSFNIEPAPAAAAPSKVSIVPKGT